MEPRTVESDASVSDSATPQTAARQASILHYL